ncbi:MAG TPA: hypothetical protein VGL72_02980, partial [Bryobacteraceae bacterium]
MKTYPGSIYPFLILPTILIAFNSFADTTPTAPAAKKAVARKTQAQKTSTATAKSTTPAVRRKTPVHRSTASSHAAVTVKPAVASNRAALVTPAVATTS